MSPPGSQLAEKSIEVISLHRTSPPRGAYRCVGESASALAAHRCAESTLVDGRRPTGCGHIADVLVRGGPVVSGSPMIPRHASTDAPQQIRRDGPRRSTGQPDQTPHATARRRATSRGVRDQSPVPPPAYALYATSVRAIHAPVARCPPE